MWLCHGQADQMKAYIIIRTSALGGWFRTEEGSVNPSKFGQLCGVVFRTSTYPPARVTQPTACSAIFFHQRELMGKHRTSELWAELHVLLGMSAEV